MGLGLHKSQADQVPPPQPLQWKAHRATSSTNSASEALLLLPGGGAYFGATLDGLRHGFGTDLTAHGELYEGEWRDGERHGAGRLVMGSGDVFVGSFQAGKRHGTGLASLQQQGHDFTVYIEVWDAGKLKSREVAPDVEPTRVKVPLAAPQPFLFPQEPEDLGIAATQAAQSIRKWTADDVQKWLKSQAGLRSLQTTFAKHRIDGEHLLLLDHAVLEDELFILRHGDRCKLLSCVEETVSRLKGSVGNKKDFRAAEPEATLPSIPKEQIQLLAPLSEGAFTDRFRPHRAQYCGKDVIVNVLGFVPLKVRDSQRLLKELQLLSTLRFPGLTQLLGIAEGSQATFLVSEYPRGSCLRAWLERPTPPAAVTGQPASTFKVAAGIAVALAFLHTYQVYHLHLSSFCIIVDNATLSVKIADYAIAKLEACLDPVAPWSQRLRLCSPWQAPEVLRNPRSRPDDKVDIYAFGVVLWELMSYRQPFSQLSPSQLVIAVGWARRRLPRIPEAPRGLFALSRACTSFNGWRRPAFGQVVHILRELETCNTGKEEALSVFFGLSGV